MRWTVVWMPLATALLVTAMVACRAARPTYEYEAPITITHTDAPGGAAAPAPPAESATSTTVPARPSSWVRGGTPK